MKVSTQDIHRIITGTEIEIKTACPLPEMKDRKWFMRQPSDWLYDMAQAVYDARRALLLAEPDIQAVAHLPPTDAWKRRQENSRKLAETRVAELEAIATRSIEDDLELKNLKFYLSVLILPSSFNRAEEIAIGAAGDARNVYLIRRLVVDDAGNLIFEPNDEEGERRWYALGRKFVDDILDPVVNRVLSLVNTAKN